MSCVVDASVRVADFQPSDVHHATSRQFFERAHELNEPLIEPSLLLCECAGAVSRRTQDPVIGAATSSTIATTPNAQMVELTSLRAEHAAAIAASHALRGADSVYVQLGIETGATLITWDNEMLARAPAIVVTMTPSDWLAANPATASLE